MVVKAIFLQTLNNYDRVYADVTSRFGKYITPSIFSKSTEPPSDLHNYVDKMTPIILLHLYGQIYDFSWKKRDFEIVLLS